MNEQMPLAQIYIKVQPFATPLSPAEGLNKGTIWSDLYEPYGGEK